MIKVKTVSFKRTDYDLPRFMMDAVEKIADHFSVPRDKRYVTDFLMIFKRSKHWKAEKLKQDLEIWKNKFTRDYSDRVKLSKIIVDSFIQCKTKEEIDELRGALLEAVLIGAKGGFKGIDSRSEMSRGWGARVYLQKGAEGVKYNCTEHREANCSNRSTVDYGEWDSRHGQFYECKVSPEGIGCKEVRYMEFLKSQLESHEISHEIFFVCAESRLNVKVRLEEYKLSPLYKPLGREDISSMLA
ncbi:hypothetical protein P4472_18225 [Bacillus subtilis]|uniref:hypothetical protein n=1 Tax=Bacillus halotolerans TaxID=260554 RepID=UPI002EC30252|nr:hypothetical protein [Bacillus subtilis]MED3694293.1 hypothetical protein [Bacillus subtilis]